MRKGIGIAAAVAAGVLVSSLNASALILTEKTEEQKLRADIQKQSHGYIACLVKAATNCEKSGNTINRECVLATSTATSPADAKGKFAGDVAKCDAKVDYLKKAKTLTATTGYTAIGCLGDTDSVTAGDQPHPDMNAYEAGAIPATKTQIDTLALALDGLTGCAMNADPLKCQAAEIKRVAGYAFAVQKCQLACENDYKNKKGNGGPNDTTTACSLNAAGNGSTGDVNFTACVDKAYGKLTKTPLPAGINVLLQLLAPPLNDASNDINNEDDCP
ncbi:MAG: hypothetical protein FJ148_14870 [Deltaproteobacteria bacterium]|nr:hypothetical protein [Deltaproteobacteria bacterium]